jgi:TPR repeat protein
MLAWILLVVILSRVSSLPFNSRPHFSILYFKSIFGCEWMNCIRGSGPIAPRSPRRVASKSTEQQQPRLLYAVAILPNGTPHDGLAPSNARNMYVDFRWNVASCIPERNLRLLWMIVSFVLLPLASSTEHDVDTSTSSTWMSVEGKESVSIYNETNICVSKANSFVFQPLYDTCDNINQENGHPSSIASSLPGAPGLLRPSDLPRPAIFNQFTRSSNVTLPGKPDPQLVQLGIIQQINQIRVEESKNHAIFKSSSSSSEIAYLPQIVDSSNVERILQLLRSYPDLDEDPDTVDGMTTHEIFVDNPEIRRRLLTNDPLLEQSIKARDTDPVALPERTRLRAELQEILLPILQERITPFVQRHYPNVCPQSENSNRACTPCYSLIRRYRSGERQSHGTHYDGHAVITVVVSLSNYGTDYTGGLYVSTGYGQRQFVPLFQGDAVSHRSTLLHGVQVFDAASAANRNRTFAAERWSWILWYRDSVDCVDYSHEWFAECAKSGDAVCQELFATKVGHVPALQNDPARVMALVVYWNRQSAEQGNGNAAVKMARAYLNLLPSPLQYNATEAKRYYRIAMASQHPDGYYGMAHLYLSSLSSHQSASTHPRKEKVLAHVVRFLEEAALRGHAYAMFNLGIVHCYGYGISRIDTELASSWFAQSGLPEGYYAAAFQAAVVGNRTRQQQYNEQARALGFYQPWRTEARRHTGSGGAGGVDLNLPWPVAQDGRKPPTF